MDESGGRRKTTLFEYSPSKESLVFMTLHHRFALATSAMVLHQPGRMRSAETAFSLIDQGWNPDALVGQGELGTRGP